MPDRYAEHVILRFYLCLYPIYFELVIIFYLRKYYKIDIIKFYVLQEIAISLASLHNPYFFTFSPRGGEFNRPIFLLKLMQ